MALQSKISPFFFLLVIGVVSATGPSVLSNIFNKRRRAPKICLNIGSWSHSVGPFIPELGLVKYTHGEPKSFAFPHMDVAGTSFGNAFLMQRTKKNIKFYIKVSKGTEYNVSLGFAEVEKRFCHENSRVLDVRVQSQKRNRIDIFKRVGCNKAFFLKFRNVTPTQKALIKISISGRRGSAVLAALCVERLGGGTSVTTPPSTRQPPTIPATIPSTAPLSTLGPSFCQQNGCLNFEGPGDYVVIGNSMSVDEDRDDCTIRSSSFANLGVPVGARVKSAMLFWSASGTITKNAEVNLNGQQVPASRTFHGGSSGYNFYGAVADVTNLIGGSGLYTVSNIWYDNGGILCTGNAAYAAWTMVVAYERPDLPVQRINICINDFIFTFPAGIYTSSVGCIAGNAMTSFAKTTVVTFESDSYKGELFSISGDFKGNNLFRGQTAPNLDILTFDVTARVRSGIHALDYTFQTYVVNSRFGNAIEGLFLAVKVVAYTL